MTDPQPASSNATNPSAPAKPEFRFAAPSGFALPRPDAHKRGEWWPEKGTAKGATLVGRYCGEKTINKDGRTAIGIQVEGQDEPTLVGVNPSLGDQLDLLYPPIYALLRITWTGEMNVGKGNPMRTFSVEILGPPEEPGALPF